MNRHKLRLKLVEVLRAINSEQDNSRVKDRTLYGRVYRGLKLNAPKSTGKMRDSLREWLRRNELTREALLDCTYDTYLESSAGHGQIPQKLLVPRERPEDKRDVHEMVISNLPSSKFYQTREWRDLRYSALIKYGNRCACCGSAPKHGVMLHVDHIKPRSIYPEYALCIDNLQILCEACNIAKSNTDETKWRS